MPKIRYKDLSFAARSLDLIRKANEILKEYAVQGFTLTLRQLYYQFVARDIIPNNMKSYKRLGSVINDGRLAGLIDWSAIVDRTRGLEAVSWWKDPQSIMSSVITSYHEDLWRTQEYRVEVWIEKDALSGVVEPICQELDVPYLSCRGYTSQSEMWGASVRLDRFVRQGQKPFIIHLGDHDPSGKDMTRDIEDRMLMFMGGTKLTRIALNMDQIRQYNPPPNPAKITDSRANAYIAEFGDDSWELDALEPRVISDLIREAVLEVRDEDKWVDAEKAQEKNRKRLETLRDKLDDEDEDEQE